MRMYKKILIPLLVVAVTLGLFRSVFFIGYVPSESMEPTLKQGSVILGWRLYKEISVGDIIVFNHEDRLLVKRVAAVGGDTVRINETDQTIPKGCFYVLGDNADNSYDSRYWSDPYVQETDILAIVICRNILPAGVLFLFSTPAGFFRFFHLPSFSIVSGAYRHTSFGNPASACCSTAEMIASIGTDLVLSEICLRICAGSSTKLLTLDSEECF